uniref:Ig-like domain-containing protein n=1 Tax=Haplochromis burtoni TaxID=8153 RepID=A0A3Q2VTV5_HAPBU
MWSLRQTHSVQLICVYVSSVSQHALAVLVQVYEAAKVALLPCRFSGFIPDQPTVMWTRSDLDPKTVHMTQEGGDDLTGQNQHYSGRTSMMVDALNTGDFSLTVRKPQRTDVGNYTCTMSDGTGERRLTDVQLQVKGQQQTPDENTGEKICPVDKGQRSNGEVVYP